MLVSSNVFPDPCRPSVTTLNAGTPPGGPGTSTRRFRRFTTSTTPPTTRPAISSPITEFIRPPPEVSGRTESPAPELIQLLCRGPETSTHTDESGRRGDGRRTGGVALGAGERDGDRQALREKPVQRGHQRRGFGVRDRHHGRDQLGAS